MNLQGVDGRSGCRAAEVRLLSLGCLAAAVATFDAACNVKSETTMGSPAAVGAAAYTGVAGQTAQGSAGSAAPSAGGASTNNVPTPLPPSAASPPPYRPTPPQ